MPFGTSNVISTVSSPMGIINGVDAGDAQLLVCETQTQLEGVVDGDLTGHTIEWEQISGTPIISWNPNQYVLDPIIVMDANADDMVFRLYIDRGLPSEIYDDVTIYKTPTTFVNLSGYSSSEFLSIGVEQIPEIYNNGTVESYSISWTPVNSSGYPSYIGVEIEIWDSVINDWITDQVFLSPNDPGIYSMAQFGVPYRVSSLWALRNGTVGKKIEDGIFVNTNGSTQPIDVSAITKINLSGNVIETYFSIYRISNDSETYSDETFVPLSNETLSGAFNIFKVSAKSETYSDSSFVHVSNLFERTAYNVTRAHGSDIGS